MPTDDPEPPRSPRLWLWFAVPIAVFALVVLWLLVVAPDRGATFTYRH
jgi:hypothetical protein